MQEKVSDNLRNKLEVLDITSQISKKHAMQQSEHTIAK